MLSLLDIAALLLTLSAGFGWLNRRFLRWPGTIGQLAMGLVASVLLVLLDLVWPQEPLHHRIVQALAAVDFRRAVLDGLLAFLLFAGALHLDFGALRGRAWPVALMATGGIMISTGVVGLAVWFLSGWLWAPIPLAIALVFGALISPTDPVAVLGTLKAVRVPKSLETDMAGESLFNDGVGVVTFVLLVHVATGEQAGVGDAAGLFLREAVGGAALGALTGWMAYRMMRVVDDYALEVMLSLALATGTYALAQAVHSSGPIAVVVAGILLGNRGARRGMSERTRRYVFGFWDVVDQGLNAVLFLLIGLEVLLLRFDAAFVPLAAAAVPIVLAGRFAAVGCAVLALRAWVPFAPGTVAILGWGGLRGGISVALALSLPNIPEQPALLAATYAVAVFSILVQGSTLAAVVRRVKRREEAGRAEADGNRTHHPLAAGRRF